MVAHSRRAAECPGVACAGGASGRATLRMAPRRPAAALAGLAAGRGRGARRVLLRAAPGPGRSGAGRAGSGRGGGGGGGGVGKMSVAGEVRRVALRGAGGPWGFRLVGGKDFEQPLTVSRVRQLRRGGSGPSLRPPCPPYSGGSIARLGWQLLPARPCRAQPRGLQSPAPPHPAPPRPGLQDYSPPPPRLETHCRWPRRDPEGVLGSNLVPPRQRSLPALRPPPLSSFGSCSPRADPGNRLFPAGRRLSFSLSCVFTRASRNTRPDPRGSFKDS